MKLNNQLYKLGALLLMVVSFSISSARGQFRPPTTQGQNKIGENPIPDYNKADDKDKDTIKKPPRVRKPLESFYFDDTLRQRRIFAWTVSLDNNNIKRQIVDTLLPGFQIDYQFHRTDLGSMYLGNIGSATMPINYFNRTEPTDFSFVNVWKPYMMTPENILFYNAKTPYSRLSYNMSGSAQVEESLFDILLSHNISPSSTFNFEYHANATKGEYLRQKTLARFFEISFAHTGKRYAVHAGYIYNHGDINENGGIVNDKDITDTVIARQQSIKVQLQKANNTYRGHTFWLSQSYGIPLRKQTDEELTIQKIPTVYVGMSANHTSMGRRYTDEGKTDYYPNTYINSKYSSDSVGQTKLDLKFFAQLQPYNRDGLLGLLTGGIGNELSTYYTADSIPIAYVPEWGEGGTTGRNTTYVYGSAEGAFKQYMRWSANMRLNMFGYRSTDLTANANIQASAYIKDHPITLGASLQFTMREPDFWTQSYFSNHFMWANSFDKESSTTINARLTAESIGLEVGGNYQLVQNKVYVDSLMMPAQTGTPLSVMGLYLQKNFRLGGFHFNHRVLMQWSTHQEIAPVPALSAYLSYYFEFDVVPKVLRLELGVDGRYYTKYYAFGYNPAVSQFYNQREKEIGGYPFIDAYAAGKWKRMRILAKLQHINANMSENRNYFLALHYPANRMMFKLGISWSFYD